MYRVVYDNVVCVAVFQHLNLVVLNRNLKYFNELHKIYLALSSIVYLRTHFNLKACNKLHLLRNLHLLREFF